VGDLVGARAVQQVRWGCPVSDWVPIRAVYTDLEQAVRASGSAANQEDSVTCRVGSLGWYDAAYGHARELGLADGLPGASLVVRAKNTGGLISFVEAARIAGAGVEDRSV